jgi:hypothetical protein
MPWPTCSGATPRRRACSQRLRSQIVSITSGQDDDPDQEETGEGYVVYELHRWSREARTMVQQLLDGADLPYAWEGTDLVVPGAFEAQVDELVAHADAAAEPVLDPDADKLVYELGDWSDEEITRFASELDDAEILFDFDSEGNLVGLADDEERIDGILDAMEFPTTARPDDDDDEDGDGDGLEAQDVLTALFLSADRLRRHASDPDGVLGLVGAAAEARSLRLPFGFEPKVWDDIVARSDTLAAAIEGDDASDEEIESQAEVLRALLATLV